MFFYGARYQKSQNAWHMDDPAETAEPIVSRFEWQGFSGPNNRMLDGGQIGAIWRIWLNALNAAASQIASTHMLN